jgi:predicted RND superfamily exporter protein
MAPILVFLNDHKAETLSNIVTASKGFAAEHSSKKIQFTLAAGNAGIEAATNEVIQASQTKMLVWVYSVVIVLCFIAFRSVRSVICVILPLMLTSILCQALMAKLNIGVKVATLPVIALGVGIGVDYGIYIFSRMQEALKKTTSLFETYKYALTYAGNAVAFTGITLAIGVFTWTFSPIKFQADMGILLTFMFIFNMLGALILLPALSWLLGIKPKPAQAG